MHILIKTLCVYSQLPQQMTVLNLGRPTTTPASANGFTDLTKPPQAGQTLSQNLWQQ